MLLFIKLILAPWRSARRRVALRHKIDGIPNCSFSPSLLRSICNRKLCVLRNIDLVIRLDQALCALSLSPPLSHSLEHMISLVIVLLLITQLVVLRETPLRNHGTQHASSRLVPLHQDPKTPVFNLTHSRVQRSRLPSTFVFPCLPVQFAMLQLVLTGIFLAVLYYPPCWHVSSSY